MSLPLRRTSVLARAHACARAAVLACLALSPAVARAAAADPCKANPAHRQLDFWIGDWDVRTAAGKAAGENHIEPILGGCVLLESWSGTGSRGRSFSLYDASRRVWHQSWVDDQGGMVLFTGGLKEGAMVFEGEGADPDGKRKRHRMTFTRIDADHVRQLGEVSADGKSWALEYDLRYARRRPAKP